VRSLWHALKSTGYSLDIDHRRIGELENLLLEGLKDYEFDPVTTTPDARVVGFPMPGGAIGPNVQMMKEAGILDRYSSVLAEFPVVVKAGGAWTSVTPGSQQYWLQAFNNVLHGRWSKIDAGYGHAVLGYFGRTPLRPDPHVVAAASRQLGKPPFDGDPLEAAPDALAQADQALRDRGLPVTDENRFLVAAAIVPGRHMDLNEGIRLLAGNPKVAVPLKTRASSAAVAPRAVEGSAPALTFNGPFSTSCLVSEGSTSRRFRVTIEPPAGIAVRVAAAPPSTAAPDRGFGGATPVYSPFAGKAELVALTVKVGEHVRAGQVVAAIEVMKARHDVRAPSGGRVIQIDASLGEDVTAETPIMLIAS
jgi:pyruvate carboxylase subunit B